MTKNASLRTQSGTKYGAIFFKKNHKKAVFNDYNDVIKPQSPKALIIFLFSHINKNKLNDAIKNIKDWF